MARLKDTLGVVNGLGRVAVAYSAEVSRELGQLVNALSTTLQNQFDREERRGHGLPDDFPGWENFASGEFGLGVESDDSVYSPSPLEPSDPLQQPPSTTNSMFGGHRSFHTLSHSHLLPGRSPGQWKSATRCYELSKTIASRYMTSRDTVLGSTSTSQETSRSVDKTHKEQQEKVGRSIKLYVASNCYVNLLSMIDFVSSPPQLKKQARERVVPASRLGRMASFGGEDQVCILTVQTYSSQVSRN